MPSAAASACQRPSSSRSGGQQVSCPHSTALALLHPTVGLGEEYGRDTINRLCTLISNSGQLHFGSTASTSIGHLSVPMSLVALSLLAS